MATQYRAGFEILARLRTVGLIVIATAAGVAVPLHGLPLDRLTTLLVIFLVYSSLYTFESGSVNRDSVAVSVLALSISYVLLPLFAVAVGTVLLSPNQLMGVLIIVAGPVTIGSALIWTQQSHGDVTVAAIGSLLSLVLAPLLTPSLLAVLADIDTSLQVVPLIIQLSVVVGIGSGLAWATPKEAIGDETLSSLSLIAISLLVYIGVATTTTSGTTLSASLKIAGVATLVTGFGLAITFLAARILELPLAQRAALFFTSSLKNIGIAVIVISSLPQAGGAILAVVTYYATEQLLSAVTVELSVV